MNEIDQNSAVNFRTKANLFKKTKSQETLDIIDCETESKIKSLYELNKGDHIVISIDFKNYCHAILDSVDADKKIIEIIYYDDSELQCSIDNLVLNIENIDNQTCKKSSVKKSKLEIDLNKIEIYQVNYDITKESLLKPEETLEKCNKLIGQTRYNIFVNNDEHFAIYCKTGKAAKLFIINPNDIKAKNIIGKDLPDKIIGTLAQQGGQILLVNTAKHIATKFPRSVISAGLPAAAEAAGSVIGIGIEGVSMGYDLYKKHKDFKEGKVSDIKFKKYIAKRVTRGTMGVVGGVTGGIIGQMVIPIPVVGAVIGSLVGGIVGAAAGQGEGILIGELVEVIDNKIKEKKAQEDIINNTNYNVLNKLVFKFEKDILSPEKYAHLNEINIDINQLDKKEELINQTKLIENIQNEINEQDYEIYVLNDSNEVVSDLNLESSLDENGAIDKRKSIETFSANQLPANINVFFKIIEQ